MNCPVQILHGTLDEVSARQRRLREVISAAETLALLCEDAQDELLKIAFADAARELLMNAAFDFLYAVIDMPWGFEFVGESR